MPATATDQGTVDPVAIVYNNAIFVLATAKAYFNWRATEGSTPEGLRPGFVEAADEADQEFNLLNAQLEAYNRGSPQADIDPPDQAVIDQSKELLQKLQNLNLTVAVQEDVNAIIVQMLKLIGSL